jgi:hypothetical protein
LNFLLYHRMNIYLDWTLQAAYFTHHGFRRRDKRTNMLLVSGNFMLLHRVLKNMFVTFHMILAYNFNIEYAIFCSTTWRHAIYICTQYVLTCIC